MSDLVERLRGDIVATLRREGQYGGVAEKIGDDVTAEYAAMCNAAADEIERLTNVEDRCKTIFVDWCNADQAADTHKSFLEMGRVLGFKISNRPRKSSAIEQARDDAIEECARVADEYAASANGDKSYHVSKIANSNAIASTIRGLKSPPNSEDQT